MMATLYLVATPIGNLEDMSPRAVRTLKEVSLIAAEDTRHSRKLLNHFEIKTPLTSFFDHNKANKLNKIVAKLEKEDIALISDAGMPAINDPGYALVRAALDAGHAVSPIPGASAPLAALAASGLPTDAFLYLGYPARKSNDRRVEFEKVKAFEYSLIWLLSPHKLVATLEDQLAVFGNRRLAVAAEMTKRFERFFRGSLEEAIQHFSQEKIRGEFTLILAGAEAQDQIWSQAHVQDAIKSGLQADQSSSQLARQIASEAAWTRSQVYELIMEIQNSKANEKP